MRYLVVLIAILFAGSVQAFDSCQSIFSKQRFTGPYLENSSSRHMQQIAAKISDFDAYAKNEYHSVEMLQRLRKLGNGYEQLIVDPGLLQNLEVFERYLISQSGEIDPWIARDRFATEPIMQTKVYRAMALTKAELASILKLGMRSNFARAIGAGQASGSKDVYSRIGRFRLGDMQRRQSNSFDDSYLISVTSYPEVAIAVAKTFERNKADSETVLFEIDISKIDLITNDSKNGIWQEVANLTGGIAFSSEGKETLVPFDRKVESFALWSIPAHKFRVVEGPRDATFRFVD